MAQKNTIEDELTLSYHGPRVAEGRMNAYDVASYIIAFSDFCGVISHKTYGEKIELKTEIQGFRNNSFDIDFLFQVTGIACTLFATTSPSPSDFIALINASIKAWIHLNGKEPKAIAETNDGKFEIENQNGVIQYFSADVVNIISNPKAGKSVEQFIKRPMENDAVDYVCIGSKSLNEPTKIEKEFAESFIPVNLEKAETQNETKMVLLIETPTFKDGNKWKFFDGQSSFYADIIDEDFINKVNDGLERFGKGDELIATVRLVQTSINDTLKMERTVVKVLEHKTHPKSQKLF